MSNVQKALSLLQPYVIGIRFLEGVPVVDTVFKEGWTLPESDTIKRVKGDESLNYHMILSEKDGIGLDDLLEYVDKTIKLNLEREKKHELLKVYANNLKELFKKNSLEKLKRLQFVFGDEELVPSLNEFEIEIDDSKTTTNEIIEETVISEMVETPETIEAPQVTKFLDKNGEEIPLTEEELEMAEEEARAERNRQILSAAKDKSEVKKINNKKIELPPRVIQQPQSPIGDCNCGPEEACDKCIDTKY